MTETKGNTNENCRTVKEERAKRGNSLTVQGSELQSSCFSHEPDTFKLDCTDTKDENPLIRSFHKVIVTRNVIELYTYESPIRVNFSTDNYSSDPTEDDFTKEIKKKFRALEYRRQATTRARNHIRRLCLANFDNHCKFITLTFKDTNLFDIKSIGWCNEKFKGFIKRMKYKFGNFKYISVIEFQDKNKRGAVHYHMIADLEYIDDEILADIWGHGFIKINDISGVDNVGAYVVKYMTKHAKDKRFDGKKSYTTSKNLTKPVVLYGDTALKVMENAELAERTPVYTNTFQSEFNGEVVYREYNLTRK